MKKENLYFQHDRPVEDALIARQDERDHILNLRRLLEKTTRREKQFLYLRLGGIEPEQLPEELGVTKQQVSALRIQLREKARSVYGNKVDKYKLHSGT